jgi:L-alanine-DL-glutamate epimerase-like enolase superfamily enzyme
MSIARELAPFNTFPSPLMIARVPSLFRTWYRDMVTALPKVENGFINVPPGAGLGLELAEDLDRKFAVSRRTSY